MFLQIGLKLFYFLQQHVVSKILGLIILFILFSSCDVEAYT